MSKYHSLKFFINHKQDCDWREHEQYGTGW